MPKSILSFSTRALLFGLACGVSSTAIGGVTLPNESYVLPTEVYVTIESGGFVFSDTGSGSDAYAKIIMSGNVVGYSPIISDDNRPNWDPDFTYAMSHSIWGGGYTEPIVIEFYDDDTGAVGGADDYFGRYVANFDFGSDPFNFVGSSRTFQLTGGLGGEFTGSIRADSLKVQLQSGQAWNAGERLILRDDRQFGEVSVFSGGTLTLPAGAEVGSGGALNIVTGGTVNANGSVTVSGGRLVDGTGGFNLATNQGLIVSADGEGEFSGDQNYSDGNWLVVESGGDVSVGGKLDVGRFGNGSVTVYGAGSTLTTNTDSGSGSFWGLVGNAGGSFRDGAHVEMGDLWLTAGSGPTSSSSLAVRTGATFEVGNLNLGTSLRGTGTLLVTDAGSVVTQRGVSTLTVGSDLAGSTAVGEITVGSGGRFVTGIGVTMIKKTGNVEVEIDGVFELKGDLVVDDGRFFQKFGSTFNHSASEVLRFRNTAIVRMAGSHDFSHGKIVEVLSGSSLTSINGFDIGHVGTGNVKVDGVGTHVITSLVGGAGSGGDWGAGDGRGDVLLSNGAKWRMDGGGMRLADLNAAAGAIGNVSITSGGEMTLVGDMKLATGLFGQATLNITGAGSLLIQDSGASLEVGSSVAGSVSTARINIDGGRFETGSGAITIGKTGWVNIDGGAFAIKGDIHVAGGTFRFDSGGFNIASGKSMRFSEGGGGEFQSGFNLGNDISLNIESGSSLTFTGGLKVGSPGGQGTILVDGVGSRLNVGTGLVSDSYFGRHDRSGVVVSHQAKLTVDGNVYFADLSIAASISDFDVLSGGSFTVTGDMSLARGSMGKATINVDGVGSYVFQSGHSILTVGGGTQGSISEGTINLSDGGKLTTGSRGAKIEETGLVNIEGGFFKATGKVDVDGGILRQSSGTLLLTAGNDLRFFNGGRGEFNGGQQELRGDQLQILSGSDVSMWRNFNLGGAGVGILAVDGVGSVFTTNASDASISYWGTAKRATAVISNGGRVVMDGGLELSVLGGSSGESSLSIESGGRFSVGNLGLAKGDAGIAGIDVMGAGSLLTQIEGASLIVGSDMVGSTSSAAINLLSGGRLTTGSGGTLINKTGSINIAGGTFDLRGDMEIRGGELTYTSGGFSLEADSTVRITNGGKATINASAALNDGRRIYVSSGGSLSYSGRVDVGNGSDGTLGVGGVGSKFTTNTTGSGDTYWGTNGGFGNVVIDSDAEAVLNSNLFLGDGIAGSRGELRLAYGGILYVNDLALAQTENGQALIEIRNAGSSLVQSGGASLVVGSSITDSVSVAMINLIGGQFVAGEGQTLINKTGTINIQGGRFESLSSITMNEGVINLSGGVLDMNGYHSINSLAGDMNFNFTGGRLEGLNSFGGNLHHEGGVLSVGSAVSDTTLIQGDYEIESGGTLALTFDALTTEENFESLLVEGVANLSGKLEIVFAAGFMVEMGGSYQVLEAESISGAFDAAEIFLNSDASSNPYLAYYTLQDATTVSLFVGSTILGDADHDGDVDDDDLASVRANFGTASAPGAQAGDANHDGVTDLADLFAVRNHFGDSIDTLSSIPEPGSMLLFAVGILFVGRRRA